MPPPVALSLCILFILYLLKIEHDRKNDVSFSLWIPTIWFMIIGTKMVYHWLNPTPFAIDASDSELEGNPVDRPIFAILILVGILILLKRRISWSEVLRKNLWILLFFAYCGVSIAWSDFPLATLKKYIKAIGCLVMILIILTEASPVEAIRTMIRRYAYIFIPLSVVFYKYYPSLGRHYNRWSGELMITGVTGHKNALGALCMVCGIILLTDLFLALRNKNAFSGKGKETFFKLTVCLMLLWFLFNIDSKTSLVGFFVGIIAYISMGMTAIRKNIKTIGYYLFIFVFIGLTFQYLFDWIPHFLSLLGRDTTLTGRTDIWKGALSLVTNPLIGTGFESFWLGDRVERFIAVFGAFGYEAHSGYVEIYLDLGIIGVILLIFLIFHAYKNAVSESELDFEYGRLLMTFWFMVITVNITESVFRPMQLVGFIFFLIAMHRPPPAMLPHRNTRD